MSVDITSIITTKYNIRTSLQNKRCLSKIDDKRYYVNHNKTLAYGHPDIPKKITKPPIHKRKRESLTTLSENELDLTKRKRAKGEIMFNQIM